MLEAFGLFVGLPPFESKNLDEESLSQAMSTHDRVGLMLAVLGQMHFFTVVQSDQAIAFEAVDHLGHGRRRESEKLCETRRHDVAALIPERVDRLEVLLNGGRCGDC